MKARKFIYGRLAILLFACFSFLGANARGILPNHPLMIGSEPGPVVNASGNANFGNQSGNQPGGFGNNSGFGSQAGGPGMNQGTPSPGGWNNPANPGWGGPNPFNPTPFNNPPFAPVNYIPSPVINANQGVVKLIGCGYDATGVWRIIPMVVSYQYDGAAYNVNVLNAWNPWSQSWNNGVDVPAFSTDYYLRGMEFSFYAPLSTGTYYFNL